MKEPQHVEVAPDGKQEIVPGVEPLKKDPKKKKTLKERWNGLKKALDSSAAFMPMMEDEQEEGEEKAPEQQMDEMLSAEPQQQEQQGQDASAGQPQEQPDEQQQGQQQGQEESFAEDESLKTILKESGYSDAEISYIVHGHSIPSPDPDEAKYNSTIMDANVSAQNAVDDASHQRQLREAEAAHQRQLREGEAALKAEHVKNMNKLQVEDAQEKKGKNKIELDHQKRMLDLEYEKTKSDQGDGKSEHSRRMSDLEYQEAKGKQGLTRIEADHKKRMLDLEYEAAKKEKELEIEFKRKEQDEKIKLMREAQQLKAVEQKEKHKIRLAEQKEAAAEDKKQTPLKKGDDHVDSGDGFEDMTLSLAAELEHLFKAEGDPRFNLPHGWSFAVDKPNLAVHFTHPEHTSPMALLYNKDSKKWEVKHGGSIAGTKMPNQAFGTKGQFDTAQEAKDFLHTYVKNVASGSTVPKIPMNSDVGIPNKVS